ncbi:MAG: hypothetical protein ABFD50_03510 [Smithella sp.]
MMIDNLKKPPNPDFSLAVDRAFIYGRKIHNPALLDIPLCDYSSIILEKIDRGIRALLFLLLRILKSGAMKHQWELIIAGYF